MLHDVDVNMTFDAWWKTVDDDEVLEVQYPHEHHGLAGRPLNHAITEAMEDFLEWMLTSNQMVVKPVAIVHSTSSSLSSPALQHLDQKSKATVSSVIGGITV